MMTNRSRTEAGAGRSSGRWLGGAHAFVAAESRSFASAQCSERDSDRAAPPAHPRAAADIEAIARTAHEVIRAWCEYNGDFSQKPWAQAEAWQRQSAFDGVRLYRDNPAADDSATHDAWLADKRRDGWTWGPVKDARAKQHPCMVAFHDLPPMQQFKDRLFRTVVRAGLDR
jgi:hypothetical protein